MKRSKVALRKEKTWLKIYKHRMDEINHTDDTIITAVNRSANVGDDQPNKHHWIKYEMKINAGKIIVMKFTQNNDTKIKIIQN